MQIEYLNINDYKLPNLTVNERKDYSIGKYGLILLNSLKTNKKGLYQELLIKDKLTDYLIDIDKYISNRINHLTRILAEKELFVSCSFIYFLNTSSITSFILGPFSS